MATRLPILLVISAGLSLGDVALAQTWQLQGGGAVHAEYNDNYFFAPTNRETATTLSLTPFFTATQRTDTSEIAAIVAAGANKVWSSEAKDYVSGRLAISGSKWDALSSTTGGISVSRTPSLQSAITSSGVIQSLAISSNASVSGAYSRALSEQWSAGITGSASANRYDSAGDESAGFQDNALWTAGGTAGYRYSSRTQFTFAGLFSHFSSDIEHSNAVTATVSVAHDFSPELIVSGSVGGFWLRSDTATGVASCAGGGCTDGSGRLKSRDSGALYGASLRYAVAEQTTLLAAVSENLTPNGTGGVAQTTTVALGATHRFGERLTGRFGAGFLRTTFPSALADSTERTYSGDVGLSYALAERWNLEGGYRYLRSQYSQNGQQPRSSVVSLTLSYNWPGASLSTRTTLLPDYSGMPGAGPASVSQHPSGAPDLTGVQPAPGEQPRSPFEPYSLP